MTTFPANRVGNPTSAWANYHAALSNKPALRDIVVYGRVLPVEDEHVSKVLQYWLFYYYNDWWNSHEADWEVAMVYLGDDERPDRSGVFEPPERDVAAVARGRRRERHAEPPDGSTSPAVPTRCTSTSRAASTTRSCGNRGRCSTSAASCS